MNFNVNKKYRTEDKTNRRIELKNSIMWKSNCKFKTENVSRKLANNNKWVYVSGFILIESSSGNFVIVVWTNRLKSIAFTHFNWLSVSHSFKLITFRIQKNYYYLSKSIRNSIQ